MGKYADKIVAHGAQTLIFASVFLVVWSVDAIPRIGCSILGLAVFCVWQDLSFCRRAASELASNDETERIEQVVQELAEKALRSMSIAVTLHQDINSKTILTDGAPKIMKPGFDRENDFTQKPFFAALRLLSA